MDNLRQINLLDTKKDILASWFHWHFFEAPKNILKIWRNFLFFNLSYFSVGFLFKTLFSPWRKIAWSYGRGFDLGRFISTLFSNVISRTLGAFVRLILILIGFLVEFFIVLSGALVWLFWILMPFFIIFGFWFGIRIVF